MEEGVSYLNDSCKSTTNIILGLFYIGIKLIYFSKGFIRNDCCLRLGTVYGLNSYANMYSKRALIDDIKGVGV